MYLNRFLTISGILPFLIILVLSLFQIYPIPLDYQFIFSTYSVIIISFIAGSHWGIAKNISNGKRIKIESNLITLIAWACILWNSIYAWVVVILCFIYLQYIDLRLRNKSYISQYYYQSRLVATSCVVVIITIFNLLASN